MICDRTRTVGTDLKDEHVKALSDAIWTHKVVVVKGQQNLEPIKQWELVTRFDPTAEQVHSHGNLDTFNKKGGMLSVCTSQLFRLSLVWNYPPPTDRFNAQKYREVMGIPGAENVRVIGKGFQGEDHYGLKNITIKHALSHDWHAKELPPGDFEAGHTRFQRWHIDAPLYGRDPAWFTTLRCVKRPRGPDVPNVTVHWDDGSGLTKETEPGLTAFFSNVQCYELMSGEEKKMADNSWVEYAPYPYQWIGDCKGRSNGLGLETQGREKTLEELGEYDPNEIKKYPMVWVNPVTGEKAFMVHGNCARKLYLRSSPDEEPKVLDDLVDIRAFLKNIQERVLKPDYVMIPKLDEGDIVMWANYQMFHSAIDYPGAYGPRTMHQTNIGASTGPVGPVPVPISA